MVICSCLYSQRLVAHHVCELGFFCCLYPNVCMYIYLHLINPVSPMYLCFSPPSHAVSVL